MKKAAIFLAMLIMLCPALMATGMAEAPEVKPLWEAGQTRDKIVIISDLHLGIDDRYSETVENRPLLVDFLNRICATGDVKELVIAGDFLDTWYLPVFYPSYEDDNQFYRDVIANNSTVFEALNRLTWSGVKLVYVPGNHDLTLEASVLQEAVPAIVQVSDAQAWEPTMPAAETRLSSSMDTAMMYSLLPIRSPMQSFAATTIPSCRQDISMLDMEQHGSLKAGLLYRRTCRL